VTIHPFENLDDVKAHIATLPGNDPSITPPQAAIGYGDYFIRFTRPSAFVIGFGQVAPVEKMIETLLADGWSETEAIHEAIYVIGAHRYSLLGVVHTRQHPHGQWEDTHRSRVWPIGETFYNMAAVHEFDPAKFHDVGWAFIRSTFAEFSAATDSEWKVSDFGG
jgi:hypothetical protein